ncbi:MAG TPA: ABC transporter permease [Chryseolinea sp.]
MIQNYLKIAWRNLRRHKLYSLINIGGLAVGMTVAIVIGLWVYDEVSYNRSHDHYEHIAQVYRRNTEPLEQHTYSSFGLPQPLAKVLTEKYGHLFKHVALIWWETDYSLRVGENNFVKKGQFVDKDVIDMFSLKMVRGSVESLNEPSAIIISESTARSLFGDGDPINQVVRMNTKIDLTIAGVYADIAANSYFGHIQFLGNFEGLKTYNEVFKANETQWGNTACRIFVQTADNVSIEQASAAIADLYLNDTPGDVAQYSKKYKTQVWLNPLKNWYLYSEFNKNGYPAGGRITFVWLFGIVGVFVLLLACINFMNLSTARNEKRAREVGIRKAVGSARSQLVNQFLSESFLVVFVAFVIALVLVALSLSFFNQLADKRISLPFANVYFWLASGVFLIVTAFLAGLYPAFYLSSFQPVKVLKGTLRLGKYAALPRKILVVVQVTVSVVLIIGTMIVYQQIQFTQQRPVGYDRQGLIRIPIHDADFDKSKWVVRDALLASGVVDDVGFSSSPVTAIWDNWGGFTWKGKNPEAESNFTVTWIDEAYGKAIQWKVLQGRDYSKAFGTDMEGVIINKAAAKYMGLENPVGEFITRNTGEDPRQIIGVVDDVIAQSPFEAVSPGFYWLGTRTDYLGQMMVRLSPGANAAEALGKIEAIARKLVPSTPFQYSFVDEEYDQKFRAEQRIGKLVSVFAGLAIFISCLGLFGLSSFVAEQKTKEIGVRKVIGASLFNVWSLLSKEFIALVFISFALATPLAYYYLQQWLLTYNYHTDISPLVFVYAGGGVLAITLVTVSFHSIKAAMANPAKSLRSE